MSALFVSYFSLSHSHTVSHTYCMYTCALSASHRCIHKPYTRTLFTQSPAYAVRTADKYAVRTLCTELVCVCVCAQFTTEGACKWSFSEISEAMNVQLSMGIERHAKVRSDTNGKRKQSFCVRYVSVGTCLCAFVCVCVCVCVCVQYGKLA